MNPQERLMALAGLEASYTDASGNRRDVPHSTRKALLAALGLPAGSAAEAARSLARLEHALAGSLVPPVVTSIAQEGAPVVPIRLPVGTRETDRLDWTATTEDNIRTDGVIEAFGLPVAAEQIYGESVCESRRWRLPVSLPLGYHLLTVGLHDRPTSRRARCKVIVAPARAYRPRAPDVGGRRWGIATRLHALRSVRNWGIGDFTDLIALIRLAARLGAACVSLDPLHALSPGDRAWINPYAPSSRLFLDPIYLDVTAVPDFADCVPAQNLTTSSEFRARLDAARADDFVDYGTVIACKQEVLRLLYRAFEESRRADPKDARVGEFEQFVRRGGDSLQHFARFHAGEGGNPNFQIYLQWQARSQLGRAEDVAIRNGLTIGVCRGIAVGAASGGAEAAEWRSLMVDGVQVGFPADARNPASEDFGLRPFDPLQLRHSGYAPFIALLRANMAPGGALRAAQVLGLMRQYWILAGSPAAHGGYVDFPWSDLVRLVALESVRNRCFVVGEDPEALPSDMREAMIPLGLLSEYVVRFASIDNLTDLKGLPHPPTPIVPNPSWRRYPVKIEDLADSPELLQAIRDAAGRYADRPLPATAPGRTKGREPLPIPHGTYRLQFGPQMQFDDAARIVPYLASLGVSHLYASPWLQARGRQSHGYDVTDYNRLNPLLGGQAGFRHLSAVLSEWGLGHIADFVPNHMGIGPGGSPWWYEMLRLGEAAPQADYFDIDRRSPHRRMRGKVDLPVLGDHYASVLNKGELMLRFNASQGRFEVRYHEHRFPIDPRDYAIPIARALTLAATDSRTVESGGYSRLGGLARDFAALPAGNDELQAPEIRREARRLEADLAELALDRPGLADCLRRGAESFAGLPADPDGFRSLHELLERQHYCLSYWRTAAEEINYRRFFNISDLAGIRIEDPTLFGVVHRLIGQLLQERHLSGLRIDHIDGMSDPAQYCVRLRELTRSASDRRTYLIVEKILGPREQLPEDWPVDGTTGYDFLAQVNAWLVDPKGESALTAVYEGFTGRYESFAEVTRKARGYVLDTMFWGELDAVARQLHGIAQGNQSARDYTLRRIRSALYQVLCHCPVYRTYVTALGATDGDRAIIAESATEAGHAFPELAEDGLLDFVAASLAGEAWRQETRCRSDETIRFAMRFQQLSGPVAAKGVEDTAFYRYNRLVSLNEVGGDPARFGFDSEELHRRNRERASLRPHSMLATSTHDTKRGEDARVRISVLSEISLEWQQNVLTWSRLNQDSAKSLPDGPAPDRNDEYLLYQTLLGAWPASLLDETHDDAELAGFRARVQAFMRKAVREAGLRSSWIRPNDAYEEAVNDFIARLLDSRREGQVYSSIRRFAGRVAALGVAGSLAQLILKYTCPGVPDLYQGSELWDLAMVDPDNRSPVDFTERSRIAASLSEMDQTSGEVRINAIDQLLDTWRDGRIKFFVLMQLLKLRREMPALLADGNYEPIAAKGAEAQRLFAFRRSRDASAVIVVVGRWLAAIAGDDPPRANPDAWADTTLLVPESSGATLRSVLDDRRIRCDVGLLPVAEAFRHLPVAVLMES